MGGTEKIKREWRRRESNIAYKMLFYCIFARLVYLFPTNFPTQPWVS